MENKFKELCVILFYLFTGGFIWYLFFHFLIKYW